MIKNYPLVREIDDEFTRNNNISHKKAMRIFEAMWKYAVHMGVSLLNDSGQEIEEIVEFKKRINAGFLKKK
ncbi:MAG: hypothetical protein JW822_05705 [Spirochaetales bacterium]|nr:hypothetical protein [Spirochaetales bacterium]